MSKYRFCLVLLVSVLALMVLGTAAFMPGHTRAETNVEPVSVQKTFPLLKSFAPAATALQQGQQDEFTAVALRKLRAEHNLKLTGGQPVESLVSRYDIETRSEKSPQELVAAGARHYQGSVTGRRHLKRVDVNLTPIGLRSVGDKILLQAVEHTTYNYEDGRPEASGLPMQSSDLINHVFAFSRGAAKNNETSRGKGKIVLATHRQVDGQSQMVYDSTGCGDPYGYYSCNGPVSPDYDDSTFCCYTEEAAYPQSFDPTNQLLAYGGSSNRTQGCEYNGYQAGEYAYNGAFRNGAGYRVFDDDCTNFVSQAAYEGGGWNWKGYAHHYRNWGLWWYNLTGYFSSGQTRSWTQAVAMHYFVLNSGRGFQTSNGCDLSSGDMIFADWQGVGVINHAMMVTGPQSCQYGFDDIFCSQHSPGRQGKSLREYQADDRT